MHRANQPHRIKKRQHGALERRINDVAMYTRYIVGLPNSTVNPEIDKEVLTATYKQKLAKAQVEVHNLKKKLGLLKKEEI